MSFCLYNIYTFFHNPPTLLTKEFFMAFQADASVADQSMDAGHAALSKGQRAVAIRHFTRAYESGSPQVRLEAAHMRAVTHRVQGDFAQAYDWFAKAFMLANRASSVRLAALSNDYAELFHDELMYGSASMHGSKVLMLKAQAIAMYRESLEYVSGRKEPVAREQAFTTQGFYGMYLFDVGTRPQGRAFIREAARGLRKSDNRRSELNNLTRLFRASYVARVTHLPLALWLVFRQEKLAIVADFKRVVAALLGNRFYHFSKKVEQNR